MTEGEKVAIAFEELKANVKNTIQRYQNMEIESKVLQGKVATANEDFEEKFRGSIEKHLKQLSKLIRILERLLTEEAEEDKMPQIMTLMEKVDIEDQRITQWAAKFGYSKSSKKARKSK